MPTMLHVTIGIPPARLSRNEKDELETLLIRGRWLRNRSRKERDQAAKTLRCLGGCQDYLLRPPQVVGKTLRVSIGGERSKIMQKFARFDRLEVPYHAAKLAELAPTLRSQSS